MVCCGCDALTVKTEVGVLVRRPQLGTLMSRTGGSAKPVVCTRTPGWLTLETNPGSCVRGGSRPVEAVDLGSAILGDQEWHGGVEAGETPLVKDEGAERTAPIGGPGGGFIKVAPGAVADEIAFPPPVGKAIPL